MYYNKEVINHSDRNTALPSVFWLENKPLLVFITELCNNCQRLQETTDGALNIPTGGEFRVQVEK